MKQVEYYKNGNRTLRIKYEGIKKLLEKKNKEIESRKRVIDKMIDNEEEYCLEINRLNNIIKEVREYIKNNKLYNEEYYTHNGDKYIKSVDDFSSRQYLLYLLDKGE